MTTVASVPGEVAAYLDELVGAMASLAELDAVYLLGSAALGAYVPGSSDVDVVAVAAGSLSLGDREALARAAELVPCPATKLELVVYPRGSSKWQINLNTGDHVSYDTRDEPGFWFVVDRAIAERHAVPLVGPPWSESFEPVTRDALVAALRESLDYVGPANLVRALAFVETGEWLSKPAAESWFADRVRAELEARP